MGTQQTSRSTHSPLQPLSAAEEAASAPRLDLATALHRPPIHEQLRPNRDARSSNWSPSLDGPGPQAFVRRIQRVPLPQRSNSGRGKGKAKRQDQDEGPSTQRGKNKQKKITADRPTPHWSPRLITRASSPSRTFWATSMSSWRARAPTTPTPSKHLYKDCELLKRFLR